MRVRTKGSEPRSRCVLMYIMIPFHPEAGRLSSIIGPPVEIGSEGRICSCLSLSILFPICAVIDTPAPAATCVPHYAGSLVSLVRTGVHRVASAWLLDRYQYDNLYTRRRCLWVWC